MRYVFHHRYFVLFFHSKESLIRVSPHVKVALLLGVLADVAVDVVLVVVLLLVPQLRHPLQQSPHGPLAPGLAPLPGRGPVGGVGLGVGVEGEEVEDLVCGHGLQGGVVAADDGVGGLELELLEAHDLLLDRVAGDQAVNVHDLKGDGVFIRYFSLTFA